MENPADCSTPEPERELIRDAAVGYTHPVEAETGDPPPSVAWFKSPPSPEEKRAHLDRTNKAHHRCKDCEVTWTSASKICWVCDESVDRFIPRPVAFRPVVTP